MKRLYNPQAPTVLEMYFTYDLSISLYSQSHSRLKLLDRSHGPFIIRSCSYVVVGALLVCGEELRAGLR